MVQTMKHSLKAAMTTGDGRPVESLLGSFLMKYRNTEHATTGVAPAEAMLGRRVRTRMDLLRPNAAEKVLNAQAQQMEKNRRFPEFTTGARVLVRNYSGGAKWKRGTVAGRTGPVSYTVNVDGLVWSRHAGQLLQARDDKHQEDNNTREMRTQARALGGLAGPSEPSAEQPPATGASGVGAQRGNQSAQSADQLELQSADQTEQPADRPTQQPADRPAQQSADRSTQPSVDQSAQQAADQPAQQSADQRTQQPADQPALPSADDQPALQSANDQQELEDDRQNLAAPRARAAKPRSPAIPESVVTRSGRKVKTPCKYRDFVQKVLDCDVCGCHAEVPE